MNGQIVASDRVFELVQLLSKVSSLHVEVEDVRVQAREIDEHRVRLFAQIIRRLSENVVENSAMGESELQEALRVRRGLVADAVDDRGYFVLLLLERLLAGLGLRLS